MASLGGPMDLDSKSVSQVDLHAAEDDDFERFSGIDGENEPDDDSEPLEKDEDEMELERLVFGDSAAFKNEIKSWKPDAMEENGEPDVEKTLANVHDSELFFLDSMSDNIITPFAREIHHTMAAADPPAWEDSDDDRMMISLNAVPRLRKLRHFEEEDAISAREYGRRLRQHFEVLNPRPKWAEWSLRGHGKKRRRSSVSERESDIDASDNDADSGLSAQPLAALLRNNTSLTRGPTLTSNKRMILRSGVIGMNRMKDIAPNQPSAITCLSVHPKLPLILSSGPSSTLYLHHLQPHPMPPDPPNPLITSLHLKHTPLTTTAFATSTSNLDIESPRIYLSSRRRYFHIWDLPTGSIKQVTQIHGNEATQRTMETLKPSPCGRYIGLLGSSRKGGGIVNILDANTTFWIAQVLVESRNGVADFSWWSDGEGMTVVGGGGEVSEWDVQSQRIIMRWNDEGAVGVTTISMGGQSGHMRSKKKKKEALWIGPDRYIAIGSTAGIVNIYDRMAILAYSKDDALVANPQPLKSLDHLTTPISHLAISPCGQVMVMASRWKRDALRLVHLPSCTVYQNWPTAKTPLGRVSAIALGEYEPAGIENKRMVLMVGNEAGALRGWENIG